MRRISKVILDGLNTVIGGKFNHQIAEGLAMTEIPKLPDELDRILKSCFPDGDLWLKYMGYERVVPEEAAAITAIKCSTDGYDISDNYVHMIKFNFKYGEFLERETSNYVWLIYTKPGGTTKLGGSNYVIKPVLTDKVISPGSANIFLRFLRDKLSVSKINKSCMMNGTRLLDMSIPCIKVYSKTPKNKVSKAKPTILHYLLGKYGFSGTLQKLRLPQVKAIASDTAHQYNQTDYCVYSSSVTKAGVGDWNSIGICFVVESKYRTRMLDQVMIAMIYLLDNFPTMPISLLESTGDWRRLLGSILFGDKQPTWLVSNMARHYHGLDTSYVTEVMQKMLEDDFGGMLGENMAEDGFFKILMIVYQNFDSWMRLSNEISASCYDKKLSINYFILYGIICEINWISWDLMEYKNNNRLTPKAVHSVVSKRFTLRKIYSISKQNISAQSISYHGDNYVYKVSTAASVQLNSTGATAAKADKGSSPIDSSTTLNESQLVAGTILSIGPKRLAPITTLNIYAPLDPVTMTIIPSENDLHHLASVREVLSHMTRHSDTSTLPKEFNRFVQYPTAPKQDW